MSEKMLHVEHPSRAHARLENGLLGRAGEFLVCSALSELGIVVHHVQSKGYDLVAETAKGLVRIQVKTRSREGTPNAGAYLFPTNIAQGRSRERGKRKARPLSSSECDVIACVAMDRRRVMFVSVASIKANCIYVNGKRFALDGLELASWTEAAR